MGDRQSRGISEPIIAETDAICQKLKEDGIAEVVVVLIDGVKQPEDWATHYGRWLGLGKKGLSTEGGNNGLVWLIRPDAAEKLTVSVGRGLPSLQPLITDRSLTGRSSISISTIMTTGC